MERRIILLIHNVRSALNVGSMLRTADGLGVEKVYLTGYTPYPYRAGDGRLPHESRKIAGRINKTALGAQHSVPWEYRPSPLKIFKLLRDDGFEIIALEQTDSAVDLNSYVPGNKTAVVVGSEVSGLDKTVRQAAAVQLEIPMSGAKESFNVAVAAGICLYHLRYAPFRK